MEASMGKAVLEKGEETYYAEIDGKITYDLQMKDDMISFLYSDKISC